ncbi:MAG TPA: tetratricopeptide repeat protein [Polyangia bacterium]|nr:tetratricopeptide repeat protein [Polyangia bacterium]
MTGTRRTLALRLARGRVALVGVCAAMASCATLPRPAAPAPDPASAGWAALADGRRAEAEHIFSERLGTTPADPLARAGRAAIAYARGETLAALDDQAAVLAALAVGDAPSPLAELLAPLAAGRVRMLWGEIGPADRARLAARLRPDELARAPALPWLARVELAQLADETARQAEDAVALARVARGDGCVEQAFDAGSLGPLPHLDLDRAAPSAAAPSAWRPLVDSGCHLDVPLAPNGHKDARLVRAAVEVPAGDYAVAVELGDEARLEVDGELVLRHGSARRYGPRLSAVRVSLTAGRHDLALRIANSGGEARVALLVLPMRAGVAVRFVDPRPARGPGAAPAVAARPDAAATWPAAGRGAEALRAYAEAFAAERLGAVDAAAVATGRLLAEPRFAVGWALAGEIAREDPTRPAALARDAARRYLRQVVSVDPGLARAWQTLAAVEMDDERPRDALVDARRAEAAAPSWWAPELLLARVLAARGLDFDAARALAQAGLKAGAASGTPSGSAPCPVLEALRHEAEGRRQLGRAAELTTALAACGGDVDARLDRARARGETTAAIALLRRALAIDPQRDDLTGELALLLAGAGRSAEAVSELAALVARDPQDPLRRVRLADAQAAAGDLASARRTIAVALDARPDVPEVRRSARALGVPLPLDQFRVDGRAVVDAFRKSGTLGGSPPPPATDSAQQGRAPSTRSAGGYPAVMVLDRAVTRVFGSGATMTLTHEIVRVDSKDAVDRWGEIQVPAGAEILTLRTHKPDGTTREPEEIAGKETISAADLAIGDYVEWELLETHAPSTAFAPGFLVERFFFQSFDAPIARSELVLVTPAGLSVAFDARAGAPRARKEARGDGTDVTTFLATDVPQLYAERSAVPAIEYVPSVRASSGVGWNAWTRYLSEELHDAVRVSPEVAALARKIGGAAGGDPSRLAAAIVDWVTENIEATDELAEPAAYTLARARGSRVTLTLALAAELGLPADAVLVRSRLVADAGAPTPPQELDDFADTLIGFGLKDRTVYADLRLRHAAFGYVPPGLDGARTLSLRDGTFGVAHGSAGGDQRTIDMTIRLDERGGGSAVATEELAGWPALEWAELVDRFGADRLRLREDFEQRWLGVQFPGARLRDLEIELPRDASGRVGTARLRYSFVSAHLAVPVDRAGAGAREMRIEPTFFRSQPGRRFAAEPQRSTALILGFDVPTRMTATVELPGAARLDARGSDLVVARAGGYRFVEARDVEPGRPNVIVLRRESTLPIMRVAPGEYAGVAADLRRVDGAEQAEIRIRLGAAGRAAGAR